MKTKQKLMNFQVTDEQRKLIVSEAKRRGLTTSAYLRSKAIEIAAVETSARDHSPFSVDNPKGGKRGSTIMQDRFDSLILPLTLTLFSSFLNSPDSPVIEILARDNCRRETRKNLKTDLPFVVGELISLADSVATEIVEAREYYVEEDQHFDETGKCLRGGHNANDNE